MNLQTPGFTAAATLAQGASRVLFLLPKAPSADSYCAAVALALGLAKEGKRVAIASPEPLPASLEWSGFRNLVKVAPKKAGEIDAAFALSVPEREAAEFLARCGVPAGVPVVHAGAAEFVAPPERKGAPDLRAAHYSSACEAAAEFLAQVSPAAAEDPDIAAHLLAGMLSETRSFQRGRLSRAAFAAAAAVSQAAPGQYHRVVSEIFKSRTLPQLALWGLLLERLAPCGRGIGCSATADEVRAAGAHFEDAETLLTDYLFTRPGADFRFAACDDGATCRVFLESDRPDWPAERLLGNFGLVRLGARRFDVAAPLRDVVSALESAPTGKRPSALRRMALAMAGR